VYDLDCEGTYFESCLVKEVCWYGACDSATQQQLAAFLKCYAGPGANDEEWTPDVSQREPCLASAGFPDPAGDAPPPVSHPTYIATAKLP